MPGDNKPTSRPTVLCHCLVVVDRAAARGFSTAESILRMQHSDVRALCAETQLSKAFVRKVLEQFMTCAETGDAFGPVAVSSPGRPHALSDEAGEYIVAVIEDWKKQGLSPSCDAISVILYEDLGVDVSKSTVHNFLKKMKYSFNLLRVRIENVGFRCE